MSELKISVDFENGSLTSKIGLTSKIRHFGKRITSKMCHLERWVSSRKDNFEN